MFSLDDSFDLSEDDFLQSALDIEQNNGVQATKEEKKQTSLPNDASSWHDTQNRLHNKHVSSAITSIRTGLEVATDIENRPLVNRVVGAQQLEQHQDSSKSKNVIHLPDDSDRLKSPVCDRVLVRDVMHSRDGNHGNDAGWDDDDDDDICDDVLNMVGSEIDSPQLSICRDQNTKMSDDRPPTAPSMRPPPARHLLPPQQNETMTSKSLPLNNPHISDMVDEMAELKPPTMAPASPSPVTRVSTTLRPLMSASLPTQAESAPTPPTKRPSLSPIRTSESASNSVKRRRKFPGPAGALPKLGRGRGLEDVSLTKPLPPVVNKVTPSQVVVNEDSIPCSQTIEMFQDAPWRTLKKELEPDAAQFMKKFSIANILRLATSRQLPRGKVPVTCVLIDTITIQNADASVVLKDESGVMQGTLHRQLLKEHTLSLQTGTALVLRQVGVFSPSGRKHYLNITPNNLVRIYCKDGEGELTCNRVGDFITDDFTIPAVDPPPASPQLAPPSDNVSFRVPQQSALFSEGGSSVRPPSATSYRLQNPQCPTRNPYNQPSTPNRYNQPRTPNPYNRPTTPSNHNTPTNRYNRPTTPNTFNRPVVPSYHNTPTNTSNRPATSNNCVQPSGTPQNLNNVRTPGFTVGFPSQNSPSPVRGVSQFAPRNQSPAAFNPRNPVAPRPNLRLPIVQTVSPANSQLAVNVLATSTPAISTQPAPNALRTASAGQATSPISRNSSVGPTRDSDQSPARGKFVFRKGPSENRSGSMHVPVNQQSSNITTPGRTLHNHQTIVPAAQSGGHKVGGTGDIAWHDDNDDQLDTLLLGLEDEMSQPF